MEGKDPQVEAKIRMCKGETVPCCSEEGEAWDGTDQTIVFQVAVSLRACRRGFQDLLKVRPHYLSRDDHDSKIRVRKQRTDISKHSILNRTIKVWSQLLVQTLATFPCKSHVVRKIIISER